MKRRLIQLYISAAIAFLTLAGCFNYSGCAEEVFNGIDLYFVRHAETVANVTGVYSEGNQRTFSELGKEQIIDLTKQLSAHKFDFICVSPKERTLRTILPYLKKYNVTAEIWPEIEECCWQSNKNVSPVARFKKGSKIILAADIKDYFCFRSSDMDYCYQSGNYADGILRLRKACDLLKERFGGSGKSILVVGHSLAGGRMIEILMEGDPIGRHYPGNARIWHLKEQPDGKFKLIRFNIHPKEQYFD